MIKVDLECPKHGVKMNVRVSMSQRVEANGDKYNSYYPCPECGDLVRKLPSACGIPRISDTNPIPLPGVGRFSSAKRMEEWAAANGQELVTPGSSRHRQIHEFAESAAHETAVAAGYRDEDHYHATVDDKKHEKAAEAREKQALRANLANDHHVHMNGEVVFDVSGYKDTLEKQGLD